MLKLTSTSTIVFIISVLSTFAQNTKSEKILIRHDTTILKADECLWLVRISATKNKSVSLAILEAIQAGKLKAFDPQTNGLIPGNKIFTWRQSTDTTMVWDSEIKKDVFKIIQKKVNPEYLTRIRVYHNWYLNTATGKLESQVKMFELLGEVRIPSSGDLIGYQTLYQIRY